MKYESGQLRINARRVLLLSASAIALASNAFGQAAPTPAPAAAPQQMVVTSRRRAERLQAVPIAVTALSATDLKRRSLTNTNDLARVVPSLYIGGQTRGDSQFYLRGQTPGIINQGVHNPSSVVIYYLEVPTLTSGPGVFYDLSGVEVLKGPQGTLFGRNTTGGAVLFTPTKPKNDLEGYIQGRYGNYNDRELEGAVNVPVVDDKLTIRVSGALARRDGFTTNVGTGQELDDRDYDSYRVQIDMHPTDDIDNLFVVDGRMVNQNGTSSIPYEFNSSQSLYVGGIPLPGPTKNTIITINPVTGVASSPIQASAAAYAQAQASAPFGIGGLPIVFASNDRPSIFCLRALGTSAGLGAGLKIFGTPACPLSLGATIAAAKKYGGFSFYNTDQLNQILAAQKKLGARAFNSNQRFMDQERATNVTDIGTWNLSPDLLIKSVSGYRFNRINQASDFAGTDFPIIRNTNGPGNFGEYGLEQFSEELQAQGNAFSSRLKYIFGTYFEHATPGQDTFSQNVQFGPPLSFKTVPAIYNALLADASSVQQHVFNDSSTSVFAHGEYDLGDWVQGLKLSGGARYNWDHRYAGLSNYLIGTKTCQPNQITGLLPHQTNAASTNYACQISESGNFRAPTFNVVLSDQIDVGWLTYASIARGYKSGGANLPSPETSTGVAEFTDFKPEYVTAYEIGSKNDYHIWNMQARTNIAAFYDNYRDPQVSYATIADGALASITRNAPTASVQGVEIEQTIIPIRNLTIGSYFSFLRAVFGPGAVLDNLDVKDRQLPYSPIQKYGINATYVIPLGDLYGTLALTGDYTRQNHYMTADPADPIDYFKGYDLVNLRADLTNIDSKPIDLGLVVNNVANATYASGGYPIFGLAGFQSRIYGEPRMIYGQLTLHFGPNAKWN